jgi:hypothetical protein
MIETNQSRSDSKHVGDSSKIELDSKCAMRIVPRLTGFPKYGDEDGILHAFWAYQCRKNRWLKLTNAWNRIRSEMGAG